MSPYTTPEVEETRCCDIPSDLTSPLPTLSDPPSVDNSNNNNNNEEEEQSASSAASEYQRLFVPRVPVLYRLSAVIEHRGASSRGHYVCYARHPTLAPPLHTRRHHTHTEETDDPEAETHWHHWFLFNDHIVTPATREDVLSAQPYILFYERYQPHSTKNASLEAQWRTPAADKAEENAHAQSFVMARERLVSLSTLSIPNDSLLSSSLLCLHGKVLICSSLPSYSFFSSSFFIIIIFLFSS